MEIWAFIWIFLFISLFSTGGFGILNLFNIFCHKDAGEHFSADIQRKIQHMYIMVPALNEVNEIEVTVNRLLRAMSPLPCKTTLIVINDGSDDGTDEKLKQFEDNQRVHILTRKLPHAREGKGKALNDGLDWITTQTHDFNHTVVGVIDSDSEPSFKILLNIFDGFTHSNYDLLQTGIAISNIHNFLTLMQEFEFGVPNLLQQIIRMGWGSAIASGNGQFMTLKMATQIKWNNSLLDDLEFSINGLLHGFRGGFLANTFMPQEGVNSYRPLVKQRVRWCQGGMQCLRRYGKCVFLSNKIPPCLKTDLIIFMILPFFSMLFTFSSFLATIVMAYHLLVFPQKTIMAVGAVLLFGMLITYLMILVANRFMRMSTYHFSRRDIVVMIAGNLLYSWMLTPVAFISFYRLTTNRCDWTKTAHESKTAQKSFHRSMPKTTVLGKSYEMTSTEDGAVRR